MNFSGKRAYITGGSSGIGKALGRELLERGAQVVLFSRNEITLAQTVSEYIRHLGEDAGKRVFYYPLDVSDQATVEEVFSKARDALGPPDILITAAGTAVPDYFTSLTPEIYREMVGVNLDGTWNTVYTLVPYMDRASHIVTVSSVAGFIGLFGYTAYSATKFGVIGFSQALRNELAGKNILVSVLCPPDTDTPQLLRENNTKPEETKAISGTIRVISPKKVAQFTVNRLGKRQFMLIPTFGARLAYWVSRLFPKLLWSSMDNKVVKMRKTDAQSSLSRDGKL